jgi:hypothetical protein
MNTSGPDVYERKNLFSGWVLWRRGAAGVLAVLFLAAACGNSLAHDPYVIIAKANLHSNRLELRMTLSGVTVESLLAAEDERMSTADVLSDLEKNRAPLNRCAADIFQVLAGNRTMAATETNVLLSSQDHVEFVLSYARPAEGRIRFNAVGLSKLPENEPYGVVLTLTESGSSRILGQKLLTTTDFSFAAEVAQSAGILSQSSTSVFDSTTNRANKSPL